MLRNPAIVVALLPFIVLFFTPRHLIIRRSQHFPPFPHLLAIRQAYE